MNTNRDIKSFQTDDNGKTLRVLLNTDEPMGATEETIEEQIEALQRRLNSIVDENDIVRVEKGGTDRTNTNDALSNLVSALENYGGMYSQFIVRRADGQGRLATPEQVMTMLNAVSKTNNLSDLNDKIVALANLLIGVQTATPVPGEPIKSYIDGLEVLISRYSTAGGSVVAVNPYRYSMLDLVNNYLSEYFLKKSNNLSDLSGIPSAVENIFGGLNEVDNNLITDANYIVMKKDTFPAQVGKVSLDILFRYYLAGKINANYGFSHPQGNWEFSGNAATATYALEAEGLSMAGGSSVMKLKSVTSPLQTLSGGGTVIFASGSDSFDADDLIVGFKIIIDGAGGAYIDGFTQERGKTAQSNGSLTVTVNVSAVSGPSATRFYVQCYYMTSQ